MRRVARFFVETTPRGLDALGYGATGSTVINSIRGDSHTSLASLLKSVRRHWPGAKRLKRKPKVRVSAGWF